MSFAIYNLVAGLTGGVRHGFGDMAFPGFVQALSIYAVGFAPAHRWPASSVRLAASCLMRSLRWRRTPRAGMNQCLMLWPTPTHVSSRRVSRIFSHFNFQAILPFQVNTNPEAMIRRLLATDTGFMSTVSVKLTALGPTPNSQPPIPQYDPRGLPKRLRSELYYCA